MARHWIVESLQYGWGYYAEDVLQSLVAGKAVLWLVEKDYNIVAAAVTEVQEFPRCKTLNIWLLAGEDFLEWKDALAELEMFGRHMGCELITAVGRPGLKKLLKELGFNVPRIMCAKRIDGTTH